MEDNLVNPGDGCRVLAISPSLEGAVLFIEHMKGLSGTVSINENPTTLSRTSGPITVPYTISNRYYSADIHFAAYEMQAVHAGLFSLDGSPDYKPPPAVVFAWIDGEPYAKHVEELSKTIAASGYEPEVSLAVRISKKAASPDTADVKSEDENMDIDTTLISFGFEYVDATREASSRVRSESDSPDDVPSLPRVLDALSTVMWPSMQPFSRSGKGQLASSLTSTARGGGDNAKRQWERDSIMEELLSVSGISGISGRDSRTVGSGAEADDNDDDLDGAPFLPYDFRGTKSVGTKLTVDQSPSIGITSSGTRTWSAFSSPSIGFSAHTQGEISMSPTDIDATTPFGTRGPSFADGGPDLSSGSDLAVEATRKKVSIGFEDDFTVFVSAPSLASNSAAVPGPLSAWYPLDAGFAPQNTADADLKLETPLVTAIATGDPLGLPPDQLDKNLLAPSDAQSALSYRSLGSVSDFGGSDVDVDEKGMRQGYTTLHDDEDEEGGENEWEDENDEGEWEDAAEEDQGDEKDMPTMDEVMAMATRIFGAMPLPGDKEVNYPLGFKSAASAFSTQSVFAAASSNLEARPKDTSSTNPKPEETEPSNSHGANRSASANANAGPDPAMLERMKRLGGMTAMSDIQFGMAAMRERSTGKMNTQSSTNPVFGPPRPPPPQTTTLPSKGEEVNIQMDSEGEDTDIPPFDLTRVLHSLQAVRGEIAGMEDEEERRRMAAKVALGFVYGMDMDGEGREGSGSRKAGAGVS
ncbi:hypothetical protein M413DRAFT_445631 [Hebeloma cylindrosporum]|uniref:Uncharacterized protein n=1 Tax=Hebeloma cylindrosporum TaxID=76867 RepID=A0A0C3C9F4_HEBCY|nr:hypothetical protein M413DRAFT_445631 [Hebeloma cylindrosporum h7]